MSLLETVTAELHHTLASVEAAGLSAHPDLHDPVGAVIMYGNAFAPSELGSPGNLRKIPETAREYHHRSLHPRLRSYSERGDPAGMAIAHSVGRLAGACIDAELMNTHPPFIIMGSSVDIASNPAVKIRNHTITSVIEYGMGVNGLVVHKRNLRRGAYAVTALQKDKGEAELIRGVADFWGIQDKLTVLDGGLKRAADLADDPAYANKASLILASHVHMAADLRQGLDAVPGLLSPDGALIALGSVDPTRPFNYNHVANILRLDARFSVQVDEHFYPHRGSRQRERLIIAKLA
jgi:hypothetical protein